MAGSGRNSSSDYVPNLIANYASKAWSGVMGLAFIPIYVRILGAESYGLIGFYATLQALCSLLDLGLSTTLNRELAQRQHGDPSCVHMVRTLEVVYWCIALIIGVVVIAIAPFAATRWLKLSGLSASSVQVSLVLMGVAIAFQWPLSLYSGGLLGLGRQKLFSFLNAIWYTLRFAGGALVVLASTTGIVGFFAWQICVAALSTLATAAFLRASVESGSATRAEFRADLLHSVWRFAGGLTAISVTVVILNQGDKILLSRLLPLAEYGRYMIAWSIASSLYLFIAPIFTVTFPLLSKYASGKNEMLLIDTYHTSSQFMAVIVLPSAAAAICFAPEILRVWGGIGPGTSHEAMLLRAMIAGVALNGLMNIPYAVQLAYGWTRLALVTNLAAVAVMVPALLFLTEKFGAIGAGLCWLGLNIGYITVNIQFMHRRLLQFEKWRWYINDSLIPGCAAVGAAIFGRWALSAFLRVPSKLCIFASVGVVWMIGLFFASLLAPNVRRKLIVVVGWLGARAPQWREL